jgi:hypothetical protein
MNGTNIKQITLQYRKSSPVACSSVLRNYIGESIGCFAQNLGIVNVFYVEIMVVILAIECTYEKYWNHIWIQCASRLVALAFKSS